MSIEKTLLLLHNSNEIIEIRIPKVGFNGKQVYSGYFNDINKCITAIKKYNGRVPAIYTNLNPINPALLARANNRIDEKSSQTSQDIDVIRRAWLYADLDPKRPAGISSTDIEHDRAIQKAYFIRDNLLEYGWGKPVICDSGNGASLLYKIELENNNIITDLIKQSLTALDYLYSDQLTEIDLTVVNPSRIIKVYGTTAKKGDSTPERPHRDSKILEIPDNIKPISKEQLEELISRLPKESKEQEDTTTQKGFDIEKWLKSFDISVSTQKPWMGGFVYSLAECPFDSNHKAPDSSIIKHKSNAISFHCFHNSCKDHTWKELREMKEPNRDQRKESTKKEDTTNEKKTCASCKYFLDLQAGKNLDGGKCKKQDNKWTNEYKSCREWEKYIEKKSKTQRENQKGDKEKSSNDTGIRFNILNSEYIIEHLPSGGLTPVLDPLTKEQICFETNDRVWANEMLKKEYIKIHESEYDKEGISHITIIDGAIPSAPKRYRLKVLHDGDTRDIYLDEGELLSQSPFRTKYAATFQVILDKQKPDEWVKSISHHLESATREIDDTNELPIITEIINYIESADVFPDKNDLILGGGRRIWKDMAKMKIWVISKELEPIAERYHIELRTLSELLRNYKDGNAVQERIGTRKYSLWPFRVSAFELRNEEKEDKL